jgi:hypothetical protein
VDKFGIIYSLYRVEEVNKILLYEIIFRPFYMLNSAIFNKSVIDLLVVSQVSDIISQIL